MTEEVESLESQPGADASPAPTEETELDLGAVEAKSKEMHRPRVG